MSRKLFVGNLPYSVTSERLQEAFSQFGTVSSSKVIVDSDRAAVQQRAVHGLHGRGALIICFHLEEGKAAAAAGLAIHDHFRRTDGAELREGFLQTLRRDRIGQIAHKQFATHSRLGAGGRMERSPARACWTTGPKRFIDI